MLKKITLFPANQNKFVRIFYTVKYLRWSQIWFRLYYRVQKLNVDAFIGIKNRKWTNVWIAPDKIMERSILCINRVKFFGEQGEIVTIKDWNCSQKSKLWLYNLHYLDELNSIHASENTTLLNEFIDKWIRENTPCQGNGWEPYPLSLRLVNLVKWFSRHADSVSPSWLASLGMQADALFCQIEYHILGNHLFVNGKALVFVGAYLNGPRAEIWLKRGLEILDQEIKEQFLPDGGHFELSTMYHATLLWDMCDLVNLAQCSGLNELNQRQIEWKKVIIQGLFWLNSMIHPDKKISFFNDAAFGIAPEYADIEYYAGQLGLDPIKKNDNDFSVNWLSSSGYCSINLGTGFKAIVDIAKIGPDYQPGHAHADSLSFELSLYNQRFLVNSGISQYGDDTQRHYERSTQAHNTVCIDGQNSSDVWAGFRVARRGYPKNRVVKQQGDSAFIAASHDGYKRLPGRTIHRRLWRFTENKLVMEDIITGRYLEAIARLYFHPIVVVKLKDNGLIHCSLGEGKEVSIRVIGYSHISIEQTYWYPQFGVKQENKCLVVGFNGSELLTEIKW